MSDPSVRKTVSSAVPSFSFLLPVFLLLVGLPCLRGQMPQKIAVLEFTSEGTAPGFEFITKSLPGTIEIELDRTGDLYVIRRYLWESVYSPGKPVTDLTSALQFGLAARIDGVVFGKVKFRKQDATVTVWICDVLKGAVIRTNRFVLPLDDTFFRGAEERTIPVVRAVTNSFPPKPKETIVRERREIRRVYADIKGRASEFRLRAGYMFNDVKLETANGASNNLTNSTVYRPANGFVLGAVYKWRMLETAAGFEYSPLTSGSITSARFKAGVWLFREIMQINLQAWYMSFRSPGLTGSGFGLVPGIVFKPGDNFSFGMDIGPSSRVAIDNASFDPSGWARRDEPRIMFDIFYRITLWRRLEAELWIGQSELAVRYEKSGGQQAEEMIGNNFVQILLSYRLGKE